MELLEISSSKPCDRAEKTLCISVVWYYVVYYFDGFFFEILRNTVYFLSPCFVLPFLSFDINEFELDRLNAAVFNGAANAVAVVDVVVGIPKLFHFEEPLVVIAKVAVKRRDRTPSIMRE